MEEADLGDRSSDWAERAAFNRALAGRGGDHRLAFRKHTLLPLDDCLYAL